MMKIEKNIFCSHTLFLLICFMMSANDLQMLYECSQIMICICFNDTLYLLLTHFQMSDSTDTIDKLLERTKDATKDFDIEHKQDVIYDFIRLVKNLHDKFYPGPKDDNLFDNLHSTFAIRSGPSLLRILNDMRDILIIEYINANNKCFIQVLDRLIINSINKLDKNILQNIDRLANNIDRNKTESSQDSDSQQAYVNRCFGRIKKSINGFSEKYCESFHKDIIKKIDELRKIHDYIPEELRSIEILRARFYYVECQHIKNDVERKCRCFRNILCDEIYSSISEIDHEMHNTIDRECLFINKELSAVTNKQKRNGRLTKEIIEEEIPNIKQQIDHVNEELRLGNSNDDPEDLKYFLKNFENCLGDLYKKLEMLEIENIRLKWRKQSLEKQLESVKNTTVFNDLKEALMYIMNFLEFQPVLTYEGSGACYKMQLIEPEPPKEHPDYNMLVIEEYLKKFDVQKFCTVTVVLSQSKCSKIVPKSGKTLNQLLSQSTETPGKKLFDINSHENTLVITKPTNEITFDSPYRRSIRTSAVRYLMKSLI